MDHLIETLSADELSQLYEKKELSPVETVKCLLGRIEEKQAEYNSFITVTAEQALQAAVESEKRIMSGKRKSVLDGIPYGAKDILYTKGIRTTFGCGIYKDFVPDYNAYVIDCLNRDGAIMMGKLNTHMLANSCTGDRSYFGAVRNPHDKQRITGGSSSGPAAALAARLVPLALGSDTGASIRLPAALCGVTGMKPTHGRVSLYGCLAVSSQVDHIGPMSRTVKDNALMLSCISGYDSRDIYSAERPVPDYVEYIGRDIKDTVIGVPWKYFADNTDKEILEIFLETVQIYKDMGAKIVDIVYPDLSEYRKAQMKQLHCDAYVEREKDIVEHPEMIDDELMARYNTGHCTGFEYVKTRKAKEKFYYLMSTLFKDIDVMMMPSTLAAAVKLQEREVTVNGKNVFIYGPYTDNLWMFDFCGFPALSLPNGFTKGGLPTGVQLAATPWQEGEIYRFAYQLENALRLNV